MRAKCERFDRKRPHANLIRKAGVYKSSVYSIKLGWSKAGLLGKIEPSRFLIMIRRQLIFWVNFMFQARFQPRVSDPEGGGD